MNIKEKRLFKQSVLELLEHTRLYGIPSENTHFVIDRMMFYRLNAIKANPEKLEIAFKLDKNGILF